MSDDFPSFDRLTVQDAARLLGVSVQTVRRWDEAGKLKSVRHPANNYRFYRVADLERFRLENVERPGGPVSAQELFASTANIEANAQLRDPQREAHAAVRQHFERSRERALVQVPVGCGKTGIMATLPFGIAQGRVLVLVPNVTIRRSVFESFDLASPRCFWSRHGVLRDVRFGPFTAVLDGPNANIHDCDESHFVIANIQQLASCADKWLPKFAPDYFDMILVDEGHHNAAESWRKVFTRFPGARVVSLTATPFRSDGQPVEGEVIYRYAFWRAMTAGFIKQIHSVNVAPAVLSFTIGSRAHRYTLDEILELREEQWFSRGVALAPECNRHIVQASIGRLRHLREHGLQHQIIAAACSVDHADQVCRLYEETGLRAATIHSDMAAAKKDEVLAKLASGRIDCIVQVQMLGEGFDHPRLSVAAVFRPFRSLAPYIQFVGRVMRVLQEGKKDHPDNHAFIVSHVGMNNDARWADFRELDLSDQALFHEWVTEQAGLTGEPVEGGGEPRRFDLGMQNAEEVISHFITQPYLNPDDNRVLDKLLEQEIMPGLKLGAVVSRAGLRAKMKEQQAKLETAPSAIVVSPQRRRQSLRKALNKRKNSVVARVLKELGMSMVGREVGQAMSSVRGSANLKAVTVLLQRKINESLGVGKGQRGEADLESTERVLSELDQLGDAIRDEVERSRAHGKGS